MILFPPELQVKQTGEDGPRAGRTSSGDTSAPGGLGPSSSNHEKSLEDFSEIQDSDNWVLKSSAVSTVDSGW